MFKGSIEDGVADAEKVLSQVAPGAVCVAQEWDDRVDCLIKLADGSVVGEWVTVSQLTEARVREVGKRLRLRSEGIEVPLVNEIPPPLRVGAASKGARR